jgi:hypothetical protein
MEQALVRARKALRKVLVEHGPMEGDLREVNWTEKPLRYD